MLFDVFSKVVFGVKPVVVDILRSKTPYVKSVRDDMIRNPPISASRYSVQRIITNPEARATYRFVWSYCVSSIHPTGLYKQIERTIPNFRYTFIRLFHINDESLIHPLTPRTCFRNYVFLHDKPFEISRASFDIKVVSIVSNLNEKWTYNRKISWSLGSHEIRV